MKIEQILLEGNGYKVVYNVRKGITMSVSYTEDEFNNLLSMAVQAKKKRDKTLKG